MASQTVTPYLTKAMYDAASATVDYFAPMCTSWFTWNVFSSVRNWRHIPDIRQPDVPFCKAVLTFPGVATERTRRLVIWVKTEHYDTPLHNHPWQVYDEHIVTGGLTDVRRKLGERSVTHVRTLIAGNMNRMRQTTSTK